MLTNRRTILGGAAALATGPAFAQGSGAPIRLGLLHDLSGPFAGAGSVPLAAGAELAIELFNERGGVDGRMVQAVSADSQSRAEVAINEAERLVSQERVDVIIGVYSSAHAVPLAQRMQAQGKILWITSAIATAVLKGKHFTTIFRPTVHSDQYGYGSIAFLAEHSQRATNIAPDRFKIGIIYEDGPYGVGVATALEENAKRLNMPIALKEGYSATAPDLSTLVTKLRRERPDAVLQVGYNPDITLFLRQAKAGGLRTRMVIGHGAGYSQIDRLTETFGAEINHFCNVDPAATQMIDPSRLTPQARELQEILLARYRARTQSNDPPTHASMGFNNAWIFLEHVLKPAVREGGGSVDAIRRAALAVDIPEGGTIQGYGVKFNPPDHELAGQNARSIAVVMQFENARSKVVWPTAIAAGPPVMPLPASSPFALR
jgi:branched-chain amino acid transport system substrate-binding protein